MVNQSPIFIGGCERSGTTLLGAMLGGHTALICPPESQFVIEAVQNRPWPPEPTAAWEAIQRHWRYKIWGLTPFKMPNVPNYAALLQWLLSQYAAEVGKSAATRWVDHTPSNIRYAHHLRQLYPQAKFIHIVRDGRAVAASVMPLDWGPNTILHVAPWWMSRTAYGLAVENTFPSKRIMRVQYEGLVTNTEKTLQQICDFLTLDFQPQMMDAAGFKAPSYTADQHQLIGRGVDASRMNRWSQTLSAREIELFEALTHDFLRYLGYKPQIGLAARGVTRREQLAQNLQERGRFLLNLYRFRQRRRVK